MDFTENILTTAEQFLQEIRRIDWFGHHKKEEAAYHVIHSVFEAHDDWNGQMFAIWESQTHELEKFAVERIGDEQIDKIFFIISAGIEDILWKKWGDFMVRWHLEEEVGLENEMLDMVKRDVSWACVEKLLHVQGFFSTLLEIYRKGYFPCAWFGEYPDGKAVVL